jgi:hypothetical protein
LLLEFSSSTPHLCFIHFSLLHVRLIFVSFIGNRYEAIKKRCRLSQAFCSYSELCSAGRELEAGNQSRGGCPQLMPWAQQLN